VRADGNRAVQLPNPQTFFYLGSHLRYTDAACICRSCGKLPLRLRVAGYPLAAAEATALVTLVCVRFRFSIVLDKTPPTLYTEKLSMLEVLLTAIRCAC